MRKNFFDRAVEYVAPGLALKRLKSRAVLHVANRQYDKMVKAQQRKYDAASKGRHYGDWHPGSLSPNQEVLRDLHVLRERSRDLCRNNTYAINAVRTICNNVVGIGIIPTAKGIKIGKNQLEALKNAWIAWGDKTVCDFDDMNTFSGLQHLALKVVIESGECIARRVRGTSKDTMPLSVQLLEGDYIDGNHHTGTWDSDGTMTYYGIKINKRGKRLGYWLYKQHPSEFSAESEFVSADDIVHLYDVERPGQIRGVPLSCGAMLRLKDLDDYELTERIRAKIAASFTIFITDNSTEGAGDTDDDELERIEPGLVKYLQPGQNVEVAHPPLTQGFGDFVKANLRGISAGFGVSYESLTNDYSQVNFSSGRMGWIEANRNYERYQWLMMIPRFCDKIYPWFIEAAQLKGIISFTAMVTVTWTPPRREMIDPLKEIGALKEGIRSGLYSWQDVVRMLGYVPEELMEELKKDKEMWDKLGLMPAVDPRFDSNRVTNEPDPGLMDENKD